MTGDRTERVIPVILIELARAKRRSRRKSRNYDDLPPAPAMALRAA